MRRWLQTIAELAVAALVHGAILTAFGLAAAQRAAPPTAPHPAPRPEETRETRTRRLQIAGPGRAAESGRQAEEMPGFPVPVAAQGAQEGRAVRLPVVAPEQVLNAAEGEQSTRTQAPAAVSRPELAQIEAQLARGAKGEPEWKLPGRQPRPLQIFPSPLPGPEPGKPSAQRRAPSGGSPKEAKLAMRGADAAPPPGSAAVVEAAAAPAARAEVPPGALTVATRRSLGQAEAREPAGGGGLRGLTPTRPEAPVAGAASDGAADGKPAGAAARGADLAPEESRDAQARPEPHADKPELAAGAAAADRAAPTRPELPADSNGRRTAQPDGKLEIERSESGPATQRNGKPAIERSEPAPPGTSVESSGPAAQRGAEPKIERSEPASPGTSVEPSGQRAAQRSAEPESGSVEQSDPDPVASVASPRRAPEVQAPLADDAVEARRRSGANVPSAATDESKRGAFSPRSSRDDRLAGPDRESHATPAGETETVASTSRTGPQPDATRARETPGALAPVSETDAAASASRIVPRPDATRARETPGTLAPVSETDAAASASRIVPRPDATRARETPGALAPVRETDTAASASRVDPRPDATSARARARAPASPEEIPATRKMDEPRSGDPAPRSREQAEVSTDPLTTGPTEGGRMTGPPNPKEAPGADPLARAGNAEPAPEQAPEPHAPQDVARSSRATPAPEVSASTGAGHARAERADRPSSSDPAPGTTDPALAAAHQSPRASPHRSDELSPPDSRDLPTVAEAPRSRDDLGPHVPRPERNPEDHPAAEGVPGGADSQQPVLLAMAPPATHSALEGSSAQLALPGDDRLDSAQRALASANQLLELAAIEGGEAGARHATEAAAALAAAEEKLRGLEAPDPTQPAASLPPQAGAVTDLPQGGGLGNSPGSPRLGGDSRLNALAQGRVNYVMSLVGPSVTRWAGREGTGRVDFRVDERGYVREVAIRRSTGDDRLDGEMEPTLHLAEPFAVTDEWISVVVRFRAPQ